MPTIDIECQSCGGTGLYIGICERDGAAVVCSACKGTGCQCFEYKPFMWRKEKRGVKRVFQSSCGICIGGNLEDFGGLSYDEWKSGANFPKGTENRICTCPAWYYQSVNYKLKPHWDECIEIGAFSDCKQFKCKDRCWKRWDKENDSS